MDRQERVSLNDWDLPPRTQQLVIEYFIRILGGQDDHIPIYIKLKEFIMKTDQLWLSEIDFSIIQTNNYFNQIKYKKIEKKNKILDKRIIFEKKLITIVNGIEFF